MVVGSLLLRFNVAIQRLEYTIATVFGRRFPPDGLCLVGLTDLNNEIKPKFALENLIGNGFLWAVPKARRSLEKRQKRKYGSPEYVMKILQPKSRILTCNSCGDDHLVGVLCPTCYKKCIDETKEMQSAIQEELKLSPVENEVVVLYEGEKDEKPDEFWEGKRIIEIPKQRPNWFSKNLLQQTTQKPSTTTDVKPSDLG